MSKQVPKPMPYFATEAEEAHWWYEQRNRLTEQAEAAAQGTLQLRRLATPSSQANSPGPSYLAK